MSIFHDLLAIYLLIPAAKSIRNLVISVGLVDMQISPSRFLQRQFDKQEELLGTFPTLMVRSKFRREKPVEVGKFIRNISTEQSPNRLDFRPPNFWGLQFHLPK